MTSEAKDCSKMNTINESDIVDDMDELISYIKDVNEYVKSLNLDGKKSKDMRTVDEITEDFKEKWNTLVNIP